MRINKSLHPATSWQDSLLRGSLGPNIATPSLKAYWASLILILVLLIGKLISVQLVNGSDYRHRAEDNRIIQRRIAAIRGALLDRNDTPLVINAPSYKRLIPGTTLSQAQFEPISKTDAESLTVNEDQWIFFDITRLYPHQTALSHVLGFLGQTTQQDLDQNTDYIAGDLIGKQGVEQLFETKLRGTPGSESIEVNSSGELVRNLGAIDPIPGSDIKLSLDLALQKVLSLSLGEKVGAAVASNPKTGEILALVSLPSFDPNNPSAAINQDNQPYFDRAISGAYPPGSVFKIVTATAGLEDGVITPSEEIEDTGEIRIDQYRYGNWYFDQYGRTDGLVNLTKGMQRSNDIYFYRLGERIGPESLANWAEIFGFGESSGLNLEGEIAGLVPSPDWKRRYLGVRWFLGNTYHFAIGQGDLQVTPIQVNRMTQIIANNGLYCPPTLLYQSQDSVLNCQELGIQQSTIDAVVAGMKAACDPEGTAFPFFEFEPDVACKTGTAQFGDPDDRTHAWFTVFAPVDNPEIVLTVLLEKGGEGSYDAAPIAKTALDSWFGNKEDSVDDN